MRAPILSDIHSSDTRRNSHSTKRDKSTKNQYRLRNLPLKKLAQREKNQQGNQYQLKE